MLSRNIPDPARNSSAATADLTLLLAEDDQLCREVAVNSLRGLFKRIIVAENGTAALQLFREHAPDLVLSDHLMPGLSGLEMFREIRAVNQDIPLILMTGYMTSETLLEAINLGVTRFIPKQSAFAVVVRVLKEMIKEFVEKRQLEQCRLTEVELLRYRDKYNSMQQEAACRKERHVARHDLRHRFITGPDGIRWGINVATSPRDIMCGDGYTIRSLPDGRQLLFVVDAMGSGLSAALSALLATSFCNYLVDHRSPPNNFSLMPFLQDFQEYLGGILLKEEVLSCEFILVDLMAQEMEMAIFGMPPLLVRKLSGSIEYLPGSNPPLSIYSGVAETSKYSLAQVADIMLMTDGVTDASLPDGGAYREQLTEDFLASPTLAALLHQFRRHTETRDQDDLTLLHLQRLDLPATWRWSRPPPLKKLHHSQTVDDLLTALRNEVALKIDECEGLETLLHEVLSMCRESGGKGTDQVGIAAQFHEKSPDYPLRQGAAPETNIAVSASLYRGGERPLLIIEVEVKDNGPGWPPKPIRDNHEENGRKTAWPNCDSYFAGGPGYRLVLLKTIEGGKRHAN